MGVFQTGGGNLCYDSCHFSPHPLSSVGVTQYVQQALDTTLLKKNIIYMHINIVKDDEENVILLTDLNLFMLNDGGLL